jgi:hypothetical protein
MTKEEFIKELKETTKGQWTLGSSNVHTLRCANNDCPITAVAKRLLGKHFANHLYRTAADELGLEYAVAGQIADAADFATWSANPNHVELRKELLAACGIEVVS